MRFSVVILIGLYIILNQATKYLEYLYSEDQSIYYPAELQPTFISSSSRMIVPAARGVKTKVAPSGKKVSPLFQAIKTRYS